MSRRPLVLALALATLLPASAFAEDLLQTYDLARNSDPQLAAAAAARLGQKEGAVQAGAALLPQINGTATLTRSHSNRADGFFTAENPDYDPTNPDPTDPNNQPTVTRFSNGISSSRSRDYSANLSQSVFDLGRISELRSQRALSKSADFDLDNAGDDLITRTASAYFNVLVQIETLAAAEAAESATKRQFDYADKRLEVGLAPITDVHEARAQYDSARANTILQRNALKDAYQALTEITGTRITNLKALPDDFHPELPSDHDVDGWVASALANNPALKSSEYKVKSSEIDVTTARSGHLPTLSFGASYGRNTGWGETGINSLSSSGFSDDDGSSRSLSLVLNVPIFSGGATQSRVRQAIAGRDVSQDQYEQLKRSIERSTRSAYQAVVAGISEVEARRLAVVSANAAYDASQVGLEVGTRTVLDVLINQQNLFDARSEYALSKYNFLQNRLELDRAAGSLSIDDIKDVNRMLTVDADARLESEALADTVPAPPQPPVVTPETVPAFPGTQATTPTPEPTPEPTPDSTPTPAPTP